MNDTHPAREQLELYVMAALTGAEREALERHVVGCEQCARALAAEARDEMALREAWSELSSSSRHAAVAAGVLPAWRRVRDGVFAFVHGFRVAPRRLWLSAAPALGCCVLVVAAGVWSYRGAGPVESTDAGNAALICIADAAAGAADLTGLGTDGSDGVSPELPATEDGQALLCADPSFAVCQ